MILITTAGQGGFGGGPPDRPARRSCAGTGPPPREGGPSRPSRSRDLPGRSGFAREHRPGDAGRLEGGSRHPAGSLTGAERDRQCREGRYRARLKITNKADAHSPIARRRIQSEIEDALVASGLSYTLLRNNAYMQNFMMMAAGIAQTSSLRTATGDGRIGHVDVRDVAAGAAEIAVSPSAHVGKTYWPGPESLSGNDVAEIFTKVLGRRITFHPISFEEQKQAMIDVGLPEPVAEDNALAVAWMADGDCDHVTDDVPQILGRPAGSFKRFAIDYAEAFS